MTPRTFALVVLGVAQAGAISSPVAAQVPAFNAAGVTMGHHHLNVVDPAVHKRIRVDESR